MTEYIISRAKIESTRLSAKVNKYLCRIIPEMDRVARVSSLPQYTVFLKIEQDSFIPGDIVWCLTTKDYTVGYIIGLSETASSRDIISILDEINKVEEQFNIPLSQYADVSFSVQDSIYLDYSNRRTGTSGRINYAGTFCIYTADGAIFIKAVSSSIQMKKTGDIQFQSKRDETHDVGGSFEIKSAKLIERPAKKESYIYQNSFEQVGGNRRTVVLGGKEEIITKDSNSTYISKKKETIGLGEERTIALGGSKTTVVAGDYTMFVGLGSVNLTAGSGLNLMAGPGGLKMLSASKIELNAPNVTIRSAVLDLKAAQIKTGVMDTRGIPGVGGFCSIKFCLFTGAPHVQNELIGVPL